MMDEQFVQNKYDIGDLVYAKDRPNRGLVINLSLDLVYFCKVQENPEIRELVYFERELTKHPEFEAKSEKGMVWENEGGFVKD